MVCLVDSEEVSRPGFIRRFLGADAGYRGFRVGPEVVLGMRLLRVTIGIYCGIKPEEVRKHLARAAEALRRDRVHRVIFAKNFTYREHILGEGFEETEGGYIMEALAGRLAIQAAVGGRTVALFAGSLTGTALTTLYELCASFRFVMAVTPRGSGSVLEELRRRTGISVLENPTARELQNADAAVFFAPPRGQVVLAEKCVAIEAVSGALEGVLYKRAVTGLTLGLKDGKESELPRDFPAQQLISAAMLAGTVKIGDLEIRDCNIMGPVRQYQGT